MLPPEIVTAPVESPVSLEMVKAHLRIDHSDEDMTLQIYVDAATEFLAGPHGILGKALVTQTWRQSYAVFTDPLLLPEFPAPIQSIEGVGYYDTGNLTQTLDPAVYSFVSDIFLGPHIVLNAGQAWPATYARSDAVGVRIIAGYGDPASVPRPIVQAILLLAGEFYCNREVTSERRYTELPYAVRILLSNYRAAVI